MVSGFLQSCHASPSIACLAYGEWLPPIMSCITLHSLSHLWWVVSSKYIMHHPSYLVSPMVSGFLQSCHASPFIVNYINIVLATVGLINNLIWKGTHTWRTVVFIQSRMLVLAMSIIIYTISYIPYYGRSRVICTPTILKLTWPLTIGQENEFCSILA